MAVNFCESSFSDFYLEEVLEAFDLESICQAWSEVSRKYLQLASLSFEKIQLENCDRVCFHIEKQRMNERILKERGVWNHQIRQRYKQFLARDLQRNVQAIVVAQFSTDFLEIKYIVTNPENLFTSKRSDFKPVRGAATFLVQHLKAIAGLRNIFKITVRAFKDAVGFYKKLGFVFDSDEELDGSVLLMNWCNQVCVHSGA